MKNTVQDSLKGVGRRLLSELYNLPHRVSGEDFDHFYQRVKSILESADVSLDDLKEGGEGTRKGELFAVLKGYISWSSSYKGGGSTSSGVPYLVEKDLNSSLLKIYVGDNIYGEFYIAPNFTTVHFFDGGVVVASHTPLYPVVYALSFTPDGKFNYIASFYTNSRPPYALLNSPNVVNGLLDVKISAHSLILSFPAVVNFTGAKGYRFEFDALRHSEDVLQVHEHPFSIYSNINNFGAFKNSDSL